MLDVALAFKNSVKETRASSTFPGITNARRFRAGPKLKTGYFSDGGFTATESVRYRLTDAGSTSSRAISWPRSYPVSEAKCASSNKTGNPGIRKQMRCCYYKWFAFDIFDKSSSAAQLATDVYFCGGRANHSRDFTCQFSRECGVACQQGADNDNEAGRHEEPPVRSLQIIATLSNSDACSKAGIRSWFGQDYRASENFTILEVVALTFIKLGVILQNFKP